MFVTQAELDDFHSFASGMIGNGGASMSLVELASAWQGTRETLDANDGIRRGLAEVDAGKHRSLDEFMSEFRRQHNIAPDA